MTRRSQSMTHPQRHNYEIDPYLWVIFLTAVASTLPGLILGFSHSEVPPQLGAILFGAAIFGAAFILSWASEAAEIDISKSLAVAILALIAVLPEYAVDFVFTWKAGKGIGNSHDNAIANMTGANRLLVGFGWPVVLLIYGWAKRKKEIILDESQRVEIFYLAMATLYSFTIPLKGSLNLIDTVVLVILFGLYIRRSAQMESAEPEFVGPVKIIANMQNLPRRIMTIAMFVFSGVVIFFVAEPFTESLVVSAQVWGISEFRAVQWIAPLASEAPEFIVACTWAFRGAAGSALKALISSKVNQWTLLVGTLPLVYAMSSGHITPFVLSDNQDHELWLTAAQSLYAVAVLVNLRFGRPEALILFGLFIFQLTFQETHVVVTFIYLALAAVAHIISRKSLIPAMMTGLGLKSRTRR
ncbi:MAG: sodium:calcium antiporter [candidate division Zixibacteria bacterium]|nr:sodium:calcium antiporter [candidate division Zixibacteria bacterium]